MSNYPTNGSCIDEWNRELDRRLSAQEREPACDGCGRHIELSQVGDERLCRECGETREDVEPFDEFTGPMPER